MSRLTGFRFIPALAFAAVLLMTAALPADAQQSNTNNARTAGSDTRTANRTADGLTIWPAWVFARPAHYDFLPMRSNHDSQHQHPQQWDGQDWDPAAWDGETWTPKTALKKFYKNRTFHKQYMAGAKRINNPKVQAQIPVLEVGPMFYKLSDLDQRRALKLLADYTQVFEGGHTMIQLLDWQTHEDVGSYTPQGMYLN